MDFLEGISLDIPCLGFLLNLLNTFFHTCFKVGDKNHAYIVDSEVVRPIAMEVA